MRVRVRARREASQKRSDPIDARQKRVEPNGKGATRQAREISSVPKMLRAKREAR